jgi:hypothetical protein
VINIPEMIVAYYADAAPYPEEQFKRRVLDRILADSRAHDALNAMSGNIEEVWEFMEACVFAEYQLRTFHDLIAEERIVGEQLQQHRKSVEDLRQFIDQATKYHDNMIVDWSPLDEKTDLAEHKRLIAERSRSSHLADHIGYQKGADYYRDALARITALINERQRSSEDAMATYSVNRKSRARTAAENTAIRYLVEDVVRTVGKPFASEVAVLAEIAFDIDHVSEDRVRELLKASRQSVDSTTK